MDTSSLMKQILSSDNLNRAYLQVVRNKGAEGVDGMKYTELKEHLVKDGEIIKEQLRTRRTVMWTQGMRSSGIMWMITRVNRLICWIRMVIT